MLSKHCVMHENGNVCMSGQRTTSKHGDVSWAKVGFQSLNEDVLMLDLPRFGGAALMSIFPVEMSIFTPVYFSFLYRKLRDRP